MCVTYYHVNQMVVKNIATLTAKLFFFTWCHIGGFVWKLFRGGFAGYKIICKNLINEGESIK
jgi:hypothetical protein